MREGPVDMDGDQITPQQILDNYLNTGDYDDCLNGWVGYFGGELSFTSADTDETFKWELKLGAAK